MTEDEILTLGEIAAERGLNAATVRNWVTSGRLPAIKDPDDSRRWLVYRRDLDTFLSEASRMDIGRPKPRGVVSTVERDDWSEAPDEATLNLVSARPSGRAAEEAVTSPRAALEQLAKSDQSWAQAIHGFQEYPARLRALAAAADMRSRTLMLAHLAGLTTNPRPGASNLPGIAPLLNPGRRRPGPPRLWKRFDEAVKVLLVALEDGQLPKLSAAFADLAPIATELAEACERDGSGVEQAV
jgi:Helix-turn-helix domain